MKNISGGVRIALPKAISTAAITGLALAVMSGAALSGDDDKKPHKEKSAAKAAKNKDASEPKHVTTAMRRAIVLKAQIWSPAPTPISTLDLRAGPKEPGSFAPNEMVTCDYVETKLSGATPKFDCAVAEGDVVKVKYGDKGEVEAEVLATRLLWALGFPADRMYPVRLACRGCSKDPWKDPHKTDETNVFEPASIERRMPGREIESDKMKGWEWSEVNLAKAPLAQRDGLKLLAVFIQHSDNKPEQQRLLCPPGGDLPSGDCRNPIMMLNDLGQTFGRANVFNRDPVSALNFSGWSKVSVWRGDEGCVGHLSRSNTGTFEDPKITEAGRAFLAGLLVQLTDTQLHDLFEVARVNLRSRKPGSDEPAASVDAWVSAFKHKRDEIVNRRCVE